jgi:hypothetical protein
MDDRLKNALDVANLMVAYNNQRDLLKEEYKEGCLYHENGHRFTIDRELINFLTSLIHIGNTEDVVILDDFENPYMIGDVKTFHEKIFDIYIETTNRYYHNYILLKKDRSISKIMGI